MRGGGRVRGGSRVTSQGRVKDWNIVRVNRVRLDDGKLNEVRLRGKSRVSGEGGVR